MASVGIRDLRKGFEPAEVNHGVSFDIAEVIIACPQERDVTMVFQDYRPAVVSAPR
jgi:ABC-type molybdate transport system ATPase subunit